MEWKEWEPIYKKILKDFGWREEDDRKAAEILDKILLGKKPPDLEKILEGKDVVICGGAPCLRDEIEKADRKKVFISADSATSILLERGIIPEIVVTDLDGEQEALMKANDDGSIFVVHAHADNVERIRKIVPLLKNVVGTTQCKPSGKLHNFGGFTDGDRCFFLAKEFGARSIQLLGFDWEEADEKKRKKLAWARKLME
jgi:hypothetical protein